jgi:hypothetical protein
MWHCIWKCSDDYKDLNIIMGPQNNSNPWYLNRVKVFINYNCQTENMKIMGTWVIDLKFATSVMSGDFVHFPICHEILTSICIWKISTLKYFKWILLYKLSVSIIYTCQVYWFESFTKSGDTQLCLWYWGWRRGNREDTKWCSEPGWISHQMKQ